VLIKEVNKADGPSPLPLSVKQLKFEFRFKFKMIYTMSRNVMIEKYTLDWLFLEFICANDFA